jgi:two-component system, OmpR family, sensor histidine kinase BaeS
MFHSLRNRLILSHILPALLIIPLMGAAMVYVLETRLLLPMVYRDLAKDATLMAEITRNQPAFWQNSEAAQALVNGVNPYLSGRVSFVTLNGRMLASSESTDSGLVTQMVELPDMRDVNQGEVIQLQRGTLAEVFTPVFNLRGQPIGIIRLTSRVVTVSDEVYQLRYLLGAVLLFGILAGIGLGSYLAFSINRPIQRVTRSIQALADGDWQAHVEEQGPDEMRTLAGTVNTLVDRLNSLEKSRRQLLANLVHELGRPLGAIRSAIQALLKGANKDPQLSSDLLVGLDGETARLQRLLDDLAGLHDQVLGKLELNRGPVQLNEWLAGTLSPWEAAAREKGLAWEAKIPPGLPVIVMDPDRMAQAVGNLLSNAVKFTPAGGKVTTIVEFMDDQLIVQLADTGPGIPVDEQKNIFQPFYRGAHGRRIVQGMGLGLSIAHDIITAHGGKIDLQSTPGTGSRFILRMPVEVPNEA